MISLIKKYLYNNFPEFLNKPALFIIRKIRFIRYRMDSLLFPQKMKYLCPCCKLKFRRFVSGNYLDYPQRFNSQRYENTKQNVLCPYCKSLPRHRILALWCEKNKDIIRSSKVLYFAPEYSMNLWLNRNKIKYITADYYSKADIKIDIQNTYLQSNSYDMIFCNHVLEHVDDFRAAIKEMYRILSVDGMFICSFPMDPNIELLDESLDVNTDEERLQRFGQNDHKRVFGMEADSFLKEVGFKVIPIKGNDYPHIILPVVGPADYDINILFCCMKKNN